MNNLCDTTHKRVDACFGRHIGPPLPRILVRSDINMGSTDEFHRALHLHLNRITIKEVEPPSDAATVEEALAVVDSVTEIIAQNHFLLIISVEPFSHPSRPLENGVVPVLIVDGTRFSCTSFAPVDVHFLRAISLGAEKVSRGFFDPLVVLDERFRELSND